MKAAKCCISATASARQTLLRRQATRGRANMNVAGPLLMATPRDPSSMTRALGLSGRFADVAADLAQ